MAAYDYLEYDEMQCALQFYMQIVSRSVEEQAPSCEVVLNFLGGCDEGQQEDEAFAEDWKALCGLPERGCGLDLVIQNREVLGVRIAIADTASWEIPGLGVRQEGCAHAGFRGTIEGLLHKVAQDVEMMRSAYLPPQQRAIDQFLARLLSVINNREAENASPPGAAESKTPLVLRIRDPSGLSVVAGEVKHQRQSLPWVVRTAFARSWIEECDLGLVDLTCPFPEVSIPSGVEEALSPAHKVANLVQAAKRVVVFSGAGISVESGITPFRTTGGGEGASLWASFDAARLTLQNFNAGAHLDEFWAMHRAVLAEVRAAAPNPAHRFFAELHARGRLGAVVTQNIDGLHACGGRVPPRKVVELHGHLRRFVCADRRSRLNPAPCGAGRCRYAVGAAALLAAGAGAAPRCPECGSPVRPEAVFFGQPLPEGAFAAAAAAVAACDLLFVVGSTLAVAPANELPAVALRRGAPLVVVNPDAARYDEHAAVAVREPAGRFLGEVAALLGWGGAQQAESR